MRFRNASRVLQRQGSGRRRSADERAVVDDVGDEACNLERLPCEGIAAAAGDRAGVHRGVAGSVRHCGQRELRAERNRGSGSIGEHRVELEGFRQAVGAAQGEHNVVVTGRGVPVFPCQRPESSPQRLASGRGWVNCHVLLFPFLALVTNPDLDVVGQCRAGASRIASGRNHNRAAHSYVHEERSVVGNVRGADASLVGQRVRDGTCGVRVGVHNRDSRKRSGGRSIRGDLVNIDLVYSGSKSSVGKDVGVVCRPRLDLRL